MAHHLEEIVSERVAWIRTLAEDQKAALHAEENRSTEEDLAELNETFGAADTNSDGFLDRAEFETFFGYMLRNYQARGTPVMDGYNYDVLFAFFNHASPENGVSISDLTTSHKMVSDEVKARLF